MNPEPRRRIEGGMCQIPKRREEKSRALVRFDLLSN